jgi:acyl carrier protein
VIRIIMDATGYERDEIEPQMDIRQDLAIRSSRLPVIMDAAERHFGITIKLEDFINARTVQEIADRIALVRERDAAVVESAAPAATPSASPRCPLPGGRKLL